MQTIEIPYKRQESFDYLPYSLRTTRTPSPVEYAPSRMRELVFNLDKEYVLPGFGQLKEQGIVLRLPGFSTERNNGYEITNQKMVFN